jgi:subtilisin family serine protease
MKSHFQIKSTVLLKRLGLFCVFSLAVFGVYAQKSKPKPIPGQYIVIMKDKFATPSGDDSTTTFKSREDKENKRKGDREKKNDNIRKFIKQKRVDGVEVFSDAAVGFSVKKLTKAKLDSLKADPNVEAVIQDVEVQYYEPVSLKDPIFQSVPDNSLKDPIFQNDRSASLKDPIFQNDTRSSSLKDPIFQNDPKFQNDSVFKTYNIDFFTRQSIAIRTAGGSVDGTKKTSAIWFLDTGIDPFHPDLNVETNAKLAVSFVMDKEKDFADHNGHGTHCAGLAAAKNDTIGITGVSAGARVIPVKVLDSLGVGSWTSVLLGLDHVATFGMPGDVVNLSLGSYDSLYNIDSVPQPLLRAIRSLGRAGIFVTMSAGNDAGDASFNIPGLVNGKNIFTTAAISTIKTIAPYSNYGAPVDFVSVGNRVMSTYKDQSYTALSGSSMASAITAGIIHANDGKPDNGEKVTINGKDYIIATINQSKKKKVK